MGDRESGLDMDMQLRADTNWFHVFHDMVESGDVAAIGPYALTIYIIIKSYVNWVVARGGSEICPSTTTIADKSGISERKVRECLQILVRHGYLAIKKNGRKNNYIVRDKIRILNSKKCVNAVAVWDYQGTTARVVQQQVQDFVRGSGQSDKEVEKTLNISNLTINVVQGDQHNKIVLACLDNISDPGVRASFERYYNTIVGVPIDSDG